MQGLGERAYLELVEKWHSHYSAIVNGIPNSERITEMITRIFAGYEMLERFFVEHEFIARDEGAKALKDLELFWDNEIIAQTVRIENQSTSKKFLRYLREMITSDSVACRVCRDDAFTPESRRKA